MTTEKDLVVDQAKRLQLAREHAGYKSARMAALRMGWKYPTYSAHENGTRKLTPSVANKYSKAFNVLGEFLLFGSSPPEWYGKSDSVVEEKLLPLRFMRLFTERSLRSTANLEMSSRTLSGRDFALPDSPDLPPDIMAYKVESEEMSPRVPAPGDVPLRPGDILIAETMPEEYAPGDTVIIYDEHYKGVGVRKVKGGVGGARVYAPLNDDYMPVKDEDAIVIGRAVMHIRKL